jgi:hypothetical protein
MGVYNAERKTVMFSKTFLKDMAERAIVTFAEVVLALVGIVWLSDPLSLLNVNWIPVIIAGLIGSVLAILKAIVASFIGDKNSASLVK